MPAGWVDGLPVGLQLVAAEGADERLLALAARHWRGLGPVHIEGAPHEHPNERLSRRKAQSWPGPRRAFATRRGAHLGAHPSGRPESAARRRCDLLAWHSHAAATAPSLAADYRPVRGSFSVNRP
ncbi:hypothetical protein WJ972_02435 [Achromobacter insuavis]